MTKAPSRTRKRATPAYDLIVLGAGASGSNVAGDAIERGYRVALIEPWLVGGTCLNAGCDPTKTLVKSAAVLDAMRHADRYGLRPHDPAFAWSNVMRHVNEVIDTIRGGDGDRNVREKGIDLFKSAGRFVSDHEIEVDGKVLTGERIVIATGARIQVPSIEGIESVGYIDNIDAVSLAELPDSLAIVGGGPIAAEFAQIFSRFGVDVTVLGSHDQLLPKEEPELSDALTGVLREEGIRFEFDVHVDRVEDLDGQKVVHGRRGNEIVTVTVAEIMMATGRRPTVSGLGLDVAGVDYGERGVTVDATMVTSVPHIWACGDVTGIYPFTHVADYQARLVAHNAFAEGPAWKADYRVIPWATYTAPELARVGLTESEAKAGGFPVVTASLEMKGISRAVVSSATTGRVKLVVDRETHQILGGHVLAENGGEMIAEIALAMRHYLPVTAITDTVHTYPTMSEGVFAAAMQVVTEELGLEA